MLATLVLLAHPDRNSFNGQWFDASIQAVRACGHEVFESDLVGQAFDPVERREQYEADLYTDSHVAFDPLKFQEAASQSGNLPRDVEVELDKIRRAERLIFHFPMWWFAPPAILKGWFDRCLMHGALHTADQRFDQGMCRGKKALFCVTTGSSEQESSASGKEGDARLLLWPLAYALRYLGMTVLQPRFVHGVHGYHRGGRKTGMEERLHQTLQQQAQVVADFDQLPEMIFNRDSDFDESGRLRSQAETHSPFIRHS